MSHNLHLSTKGSLWQKRRDSGDPEMSISQMDEKWNWRTLLYPLRCMQQNWSQIFQFSSPPTCAWRGGRKKIKLLAFVDSRKANKEGKQRERTVKQQGETTCQPGQYCICPMSLLEQLQDANNYVVNITKPRSLQEREDRTALEQDQHSLGLKKTEQYVDLPHYLKLFGMMQAPCPVYCNITDLRKER